MANNDTAETPVLSDERVKSQIEHALNETVDALEKTTAEVQSLSADDAERSLDEACNKCIATFTSRIKNIRDSAKQVKPNPSSSTYTEDYKKYITYIDAVASGIEKGQSLFDVVFERIRNIVSIIVNCIRAGVNWAWDQLTEAFNSIRSLWTS